MELNNPDIIYLTSDLSSPHTEKRNNFFKKNNLNVQIIGSVNTKNAYNSKEKKTYIFNYESGLLGYAKRIYLSLKFVWKNKNKLRNNFIIARGLDFYLALKICNVNFIPEYCDISNVELRLKFVRKYVKDILLSSNFILTTSRGFLRFHSIEKNISFMWPNNPHGVKTQSDLTNKRRTVAYLGYLRNYQDLEELNSKGIEIAIYGKFNIQGAGKVPKSILENYKGEYNFEELGLIYRNHWFSYVQDNYSESSKYSLTNRLYESILSFSIPVINGKNTYLYEYINNLGLNYIDMSQKKYIKTMRQIDEGKMNHYVLQNYKILTDVLSSDEKKLICCLKNEIEGIST